MSANLDKDYKPQSGHNRFDIYKKIDEPIDFPVINGGEYLLNHLKQIGMYKSGGMSAIPIDYQDIYYYGLASGLEFQKREIDIMVDMSRAYVKFVTDGNPSIDAPYTKKVV